MVNYIFKVEIFIKVTLSRIKRKDTGRCFGLIVVSIKVNGEMEFKMEKDKSIYQVEIL
jgi:hypothetical protein